MNRLKDKIDVKEYTTLDEWLCRNNNNFNTGDADDNTDIKELDSFNEQGDAPDNSPAADTCDGEEPLSENPADS